MKTETKGIISLPVRVVANANHLGFRLEDADNRHVFIGSTNEDTAHAIATALNGQPALLAACEAALKAMRLHGDSFYDGQINQLRSAIAAARGKG